MQQFLLVPLNSLSYKLLIGKLGKALLLPHQLSIIMNLNKEQSLQSQQMEKPSLLQNLSNIVITQLYKIMMEFNSQ